MGDFFDDISRKAQARRNLTFEKQKTLLNSGILTPSMTNGSLDGNLTDEQIIEKNELIEAEEQQAYNDAIALPVGMGEGALGILGDLEILGQGIGGAYNAERGQKWDGFVDAMGKRQEEGTSFWSTLDNQKRTDGWLEGTELGDRLKDGSGGRLVGEILAPIPVPKGIMQAGKIGAKIASHPMTRYAAETAKTEVFNAVNNVGTTGPLNRGMSMFTPPKQNMVIGEGSTKFDMPSYKEFKKQIDVDAVMANRKKTGKFAPTPDEQRLWEETSKRGNPTFIDADGIIKQEIPTGPMNLKAPLLKGQPQFALRNLAMNSYKSTRGTGAGKGLDTQTRLAKMTDEQVNRTGANAFVNGNDVTLNPNLSKADFNESLAHEAQHMIQDAENFKGANWSTGSSPELFTGKQFDNILERAEEAEDVFSKEFAKLVKAGKATDDEYFDVMQEVTPNLFSAQVRKDALLGMRDYDNLKFGEKSKGHFFNNGDKPYFADAGELTPRVTGARAHLNKQGIADNHILNAMDEDFKGFGFTTKDMYPPEVLERFKNGRLRDQAVMDGLNKTEYGQMLDGELTKFSASSFKQAMKDAIKKRKIPSVLKDGKFKVNDMKGTMGHGYEVNFSMDGSDWSFGIPSTPRNPEGAVKNILHNVGKFFTKGSDWYLDKDLADIIVKPGDDVSRKLLSDAKASKRTSYSMPMPKSNTADYGINTKQPNPNVRIGADRNLREPNILSDKDLINPKDRPANLNQADKDSFYNTLDEGSTNWNNKQSPAEKGYGLENTIKDYANDYRATDGTGKVTRLVGNKQKKLGYRGDPLLDSDWFDQFTLTQTPTKDAVKYGANGDQLVSPMNNVLDANGGVTKQPSTGLNSKAISNMNPMEAARPKGMRGFAELKEELRALHKEAKGDPVMQQQIRDRIVQVDKEMRMFDSDSARSKRSMFDEGDDKLATELEDAYTPDKSGTTNIDQNIRTADLDDTHFTGKYGVNDNPKNISDINIQGGKAKADLIDNPPVMSSPNKVLNDKYNNTINSINSALKNRRLTPDENINSIMRVVSDLQAQSVPKLQKTREPFLRAREEMLNYAYDAMESIQKASYTGDSKSVLNKVPTRNLDTIPADVKSVTLPKTKTRFDTQQDYEFDELARSWERDPMNIKTRERYLPNGKREDKARDLGWSKKKDNFFEELEQPRTSYSMPSNGNVLHPDNVDPVALADAYAKRSEIRRRTRDILGKTSAKNLLKDDYIAAGTLDELNDIGKEINYASGKTSPKPTKSPEVQKLHDELQEIKAQIKEELGLDKIDDINATNLKSSKLHADLRAKELEVERASGKRPPRTRNVVDKEWYKFVPKDDQKKFEALLDERNRHNNIAEKHFGKTVRGSKGVTADEFRELGLYDIMIKNREDRVAWKKKYDPDFKGKINALVNKRHAAKLKAIPKYQTPEDVLKIEQFYQDAQRLTLETGIKHEVDHIYPIQGKNYRGKHAPENLQIVPKSWNATKSNRVPVNLRELFYQEGLLND